jgi:hypothetical protein
MPLLRRIGRHSEQGIDLPIPKPRVSAQMLSAGMLASKLPQNLVLVSNASDSKHTWSSCRMSTNAVSFTLRAVSRARIVSLWPCNRSSAALSRSIKCCISLLSRSSVAGPNSILLRPSLCCLLARQGFTACKSTKAFLWSIFVLVLNKWVLHVMNTILCLVQEEA